MKTTLNKIRQFKPCASSWIKLLKYLNKTRGDKEDLPLLTILESNGLKDTFWCFRTVEGCDKEIILYIVWCVRQVQHLMYDERSINCLDLTEKFANGNATKEELVAATEAAWNAVKGFNVHTTAYDAARAAAYAGRSSAIDFDCTCACKSAADAHSRDVVDKYKDIYWDAARSRQEKELRRILTEREK